jgi:enterochelin esterase-like enzyme
VKHQTIPADLTGKPIARFAAVAAVVSSLLLWGASSPAVAEDDTGLNLGPQVVKTDAGPTGYSVTFRYDAPDDVERVRIWGEWQFSDPAAIISTTSAEGRFGSDWKPGDVIAPSAPGFLLSDMAKGEDGVWSWTTPLPAGTFSYHFVHEECPGPSNSGCTRYVDPANPGWASQLTPTGAQTFSQVHVPAHPLHPTYDYPYQTPTSPERTGTYEHRQYTSPNSTTPPGTHHLVVYLPAGYDPEREVPYPTLYLSHGQGGNEAHWNAQGLSNFIMENLVADGLAQPMVIVGTNFNGLAGDPGYAEDVIQNVIPFMEQEYNVSTRAEDRAFGGQSLGGARALGLLYNHTPTFEYYGAWASAAFPGLPNAAQLENMKGVRGGIHMGTGLQDYLGNIGPNSVARAETLRNQGVEVVEYNVNGTHTWDVARQLYEHYLRNVAFRTTTTTLGFESRGVVTWASAIVAPLGSSQVSLTGSVEFRHDGEVIGVAPLNADGVARLRLGSPKQVPVGPIEAHYLGDDLFNGSHSALSPAPPVTRPPGALGSATAPGASVIETGAAP